MTKKRKPQKPRRAPKQLSIARRIQKLIRAAPPAFKKSELQRKPFLAFAFSTCGQGFRAYRAYVKLVRSGFLLSSGPLLRTLVELVLELQFAYVQPDRDEAATKSFIFTAIRQYNTRRKINVQDPDLPRLKAAAERAAAKGGFKLSQRHWSGVNDLFARAQVIASKTGRPEALDLYNYPYRLMSELAHASPVGQNFFLEANGQEIRLKDNEMDSKYHGLWTANYAALLMLVSLYEAMGVDNKTLDDLVHELVNSWPNT